MNGSPQHPNPGQRKHPSRVIRRMLPTCVESIITTRKEVWLEERCQQLAQQNENLRARVEELQHLLAEQPSGLAQAGLVPLAPMRGAPVAPGMRLPGHQRSTRGSVIRSSMPDPDATAPRKDSVNELAALAVAAAAQEVADYQSSLVRVHTDNERNDDVTEVTVTAPNRERLLSDMTGALSGLGLHVREARITTEGTSAKNTFLVQDSGGKKVLDPMRLHAITQRLQQRFMGEQGLNGGVRRLVVDRFIQAPPPRKSPRPSSRPARSCPPRASPFAPPRPLLRPPCSRVRRRRRRGSTSRCPKRRRSPSRSKCG